MEDKNQSNFKHQNYGVYGRIKKAITFTSPFKQSPASAHPINDSNSTPQYPKVSKIKTSHPGFSGAKDRAVRTAGVDPGVKKNEQGSNDRFSDYIKRAKMKMRRSMTVVGSGGGDGGKSTSRRASINQKTSAYIDRAKLKLRNASVVGFGKKAK